MSTSDDVIRPPSSSVVDGVASPSLQSICATDAATHGALPGDRLAQGLITAALGRGPIPTWAPADCARLSS